ncbi:MAG: ABC transporter permease [Longimicrobiales bacterium]
MHPGVFTDVRIAARTLRREPGFVFLVVLALSVGIGSTATVFGTVNRLVWRPVPGVPDPTRAVHMVALTAEGTSISTGWFSSTRAELEELREGATLLTGLASFGFSGSPRVSGPGGAPVRVAMQAVYGDYFGILGVHPAAGRLFRADETGVDADPLVAVISQDLAAKLFGSAEEAAGRTMLVDGRSVQVLGVAGGGFRGTLRAHETDVWLPYSSLAVFNGFSLGDLRDRRMADWVVARLQGRADAESAEAQLNSVLQRIVEERPEGGESLGSQRLLLLPGLSLPPEALEPTYAMLRLFGGLVTLVLLIACANVATLLLARNVVRRGAIATRRALGASPTRIARYHLMESLLLALLGSMAGLGVAWLLGLPFRSIRLPGLPTFGAFGIDVRVLAFAAAAAVVTALLFGAAPAVLAGRMDLGETLRGGGSTGTARFEGPRRLLSAGQVAVSITLLVGAILLARSMQGLLAVDTGFAVDDIATVDLGTPDDLGKAADLPVVYRSLLDEVRRARGVEGAALDMAGPFDRAGSQIALPETPLSNGLTAVIRPVSAGWLSLLDVPVLRGRPFAEREWETGAPVPVVLTAALARRLFGTTDVIGRAVHMNLGSDAPGEVVAVTADMNVPSEPARAIEAFLIPIESFPYLKSVTLLLRTSRLDAEVVSGVRRAVEQVVPSVVGVTPAPLLGSSSAQFSEQRGLRLLLGLLSAMAVGLATVGLYGVVSFGVARRAREIGIRIALGAERARIARLVLADAAIIVGGGTLVGLTGALILSALLQRWLFGIEPVDPVSYAAAALLFSLVALLACWAPTRAATRADPVEVLKAG